MAPLDATVRTGWSDRLHPPTMINCCHGQSRGLAGVMQLMIYLQPDRSATPCGAVDAAAPKKALVGSSPCQVGCCRGDDASIAGPGFQASSQAAAIANWANAGSDLEAVFCMIEARWFSTVRWLMPRSAAMFLLG